MFPVHRTFPKEMAIIGRLLLDYGELELDLMNCVQVARDYDLNGTLKAMFRVRGETNRVLICRRFGTRLVREVGAGHGIWFADRHPQKLPRYPQPLCSRLLA